MVADLSWIDRYETLHAHTDGALVVVVGSLPIRDEDVEVDRFGIRITWNPAVFRQLPKVEEVGGRIPRSADRHMNDDGSACVCLPDDYWIRHPGEFEMPVFIDGPVRNFFLAQAVVERGQPWPFGEWAHGEAGRVQFYAERAGLPSTRLVIGELLRYAVAPVMKGHWPCPCGSGERLRDCHADQVAAFRAQVPPGVARSLMARAR